MLTRRQRMILDEIRLAHAAGFHPSPVHLADRIGIGGRQAIRADIGRLIIDGDIVGVTEGRGSAPAQYRLRLCPCPTCSPAI